MFKKLTTKYLKRVLRSPAIRDAIAKAIEREEKDLPLFDFSTGNTGRLLMKYNIFENFSMNIKDTPEQFRDIANAIIKSLKEGFVKAPQGLSYSPSGGTEGQRKIAIEYFRKIHGIPLTQKDTDKVIITSGSQQAMSASLRSILANSQVLVPRWESALVVDIASGAGWRLEKLPPIDGLGFNPEDLEEAAKPGSVFYLSMPNNPSGYLSSEKLKAAVEIMEKKGGAVIWDASSLFTLCKLENDQAKFDPSFIADEINDFKTITEKHYKSMCVISSISKTCLATGVRFGFTYACKEWIENMNAIIGSENLSSPVLSFIIGSNILQTFLEKDPKPYEWISKILADRINCLLEKGVPLILPKNAKFGGLCVLMATGRSATEFAKKFLEKGGIVSVPGKLFYGDKFNAVRLSLVSVPYVEGDQLWKENVNKLVEIIKLEETVSYLDGMT